MLLVVLVYEDFFWSLFFLLLLPFFWIGILQLAVDCSLVSMASDDVLRHA